MVSFGIFLSFLTGFVTVNLISLKFSLIEKLGLSFPIGIALQTLLMLLMDAVGIPLTRVSILVASVLLILSLSFPMIFRREELVQEIRKPVSFDFSGFNLVWLLFVLLIIILEYMNFSRWVHHFPRAYVKRPFHISGRLYAVYTPTGKLYYLYPYGSAQLCLCLFIGSTHVEVDSGVDVSFLPDCFLCGLMPGS